MKIRLFLLALLSTAAVATLQAFPGGETKESLDIQEDPRSLSVAQKENQGRRISECLDWDDLLQGFPQETTLSTEPSNADQKDSNSNQQNTPLIDRYQTFVELAAALRQAYGRGDKDHPDWNLVTAWIDALRPEDGEEHAERRLSLGTREKEAQEAEAEELQYHFLKQTLPAIKIASVTAALHNPNRFQENLIEKSQKEKDAWIEAQKKFEEDCKESFLAPYQDDKDTQYLDERDESFIKDDPTLYGDYLQRFSYYIARCGIQMELHDLHYNIKQKIIQSGVCKNDFEIRALTEAKIRKDYELIFAKISRAKESSPVVVRDKWDQFQKEAAAFSLEDLVQVGKIKLWKNRQQVNTIHKATIKSQEQTERAFDNHKVDQCKVDQWKKHLETKYHTALALWAERKEQLELFQRNLKLQKEALSLKNIATSIEQYITEELATATDAIKHWKKHQDQVPLMIPKSELAPYFKGTIELYKIAWEQYRVEQQLRGHGNRVLAQYNKEKYLRLAEEQYKKTMDLFKTLKANISNTLYSAWEEHGQEIRRECLGYRLFLHKSVKTSELSEELQRKGVSDK